MLLHLSQTFALSLAILFVAVAGNDNIASGQDDFIGEGQPVNRVIELRQQSSQPVDSLAAGTDVSPAPQAAGASGTTNAPPKIEFDEIKAPSAFPNRLTPIHFNKPAPPVNEGLESSPTIPAVSDNWDATAKAIPRIGPKSQSEQDLVTVQKSSSLLVTEINSPKFVNVNQTALFVIKIRNQGKDSVENVKLVAQLPAHTKLGSASPAPSDFDDQRCEFAISSIEANGVREIRLDLVPTEKLPIEIATQIIVENQQRTSVSVRQPVLSLVLNGPLQANIGQTVTHELIVTNAGDGIATDIHLDAVLPEQLELLEQSVGPVIPSIEPGKSARVTYQSQALTPGSIQLVFDAKTEGAPGSSLESTFHIYQPEMRISAVGPKLNYVQRDGIYTISIDNTGEVDVTDIQVSLAIPEGMNVTTISREANMDSANSTLTWSFPKIASRATEQIQLKATAINEGLQVCNIQVSSHETPKKEIKLITEAITRADLSVRIRNVTGPVQVGGKAEFLVEVENQGSRSANDVSVHITLPESLMPVANDSESAERSDNGIAFAEPVIGPGQKVSFKFTAVGVLEGEYVVRSILQADGSGRQIVSEDTVLVYEVGEARVSESTIGEVRR